MGKLIGVDLGTTNSCVAILEGGSAQVVANSEGARTTPSMVGFTDSGEKLVGQVAKRQGVTNPERTIYAVKRLIGRKRESEEVERFAAISPFGIEAAENGDAWVRVEERLCSPQEISAVVLAKMRETAADFLGEEVTDAVITVPAYFKTSTRRSRCSTSGAARSTSRSSSSPTASSRSRARTGTPTWAARTSTSVSSTT
jgi:molecular chaperone DnaK